MTVSPVSNGFARQPVGTTPAAILPGRGRETISSLGTSAFATQLKNAQSAPAAARKNDPFVQLEAGFLRNFVETMLPKDTGSMFSAGMAGDYWRSMLADEVSQALAQSGRFGIAGTLRSRIEKPVNAEN